MYNAIEVVTVFFECFIVYIYINGLYNRNEASWKFVALLYFIFSIILIALSLLPISPVIRIAFTFVGIVILTLMLMDTKPLFAIFGTALFCVISVLVELLCMSALNLFGYEIQDLLSSGSNRAIYIIFSKIVELMIVLIITSALNKNKDSLTLKQLLPLIPCQLFGVYYCDYLFSKSYGEKLPVSFIVILVGLLYINAIVIVYVKVMKASVDTKQKEELTKQQFEMQVKYYEQVRSDQDATRSLWHDIKKYIIAMQALADKGTDNEKNLLLQQVNEAFSPLGAVVDVDNPIVSAILNHAVQNAINAGIHVDLDVQVPSELSVEAIDLSVIIGNTFDNSIEANSDIESVDKRISVVLKKKDGILFYEIINPCTKPSKKPGKYHGYGLKNVRTCVERYRGTMTSGANDGIFAVSICLNCQTEALQSNLMVCLNESV